jgi:cation:H+ antiporter
MSITLLSFFFTAVSLFFLVQAASWMLDGAVAIAEKMNLSPLIIGTVIVAVGTALPTIAVTLAILVSPQPNYDIALGNIIGTNYVNLGLALGIPAFLTTIITKYNAFEKEIPIYLALCAILSSFAVKGSIEKVDGIILFCLYAIILFIVYQYAKREHVIEKSEVLQQRRGKRKESKSVVIAVSKVVVGTIVVVLAAFLLTYAAPAVAQVLHMSDYVLGLTLVGVGTSLPTIAASIQAARKNNTDIVLGNVFGGNIVNIALGIGLPAMFHALPLSRSAQEDLSFTNLFNMAILLLILVEMKLASKNKALSRFDGAAIIFIYCAYIVFKILGNKG